MPGGEDRHHPYRWIIFSAMAAVYFAFGVMVMSIPPMVSTVRADLGISRTAMGLALGAWALIYIASAPPAGRIIDRIGLRRSIALGAAFVAASGFARAAAQGLGSLWLAVAVFGVGGPLVSAAAPKLIAVWFGDERERRVAVGLYTAAPALGGMSSLLLTNSVLLPWLGDWRSVVVLYSCIAVAAGLGWVVVAGLAPAVPGHASTSGPVGRGEWRRLLGSPGVQLALVLGLGSFFVNHALASWLPNVLETDSGLSPTAASNWAALSGAMGVIAGMTLPRFATPARRMRVLAGVMAVMAVSLFAIAFGDTTVDVVAAVALGTRASLIPLVIVVLMEADRVTPANMGLANGIWFSVVEIGGTTGPLTVGAISDTGGGFAAAMAVLGGLLLLLIMVALTWRRGTVMA